MKKNSLTLIGTGLLLAAATGAYALATGGPTLTGFLNPKAETASQQIQMIEAQGILDSKVTESKLIAVDEVAPVDAAVGAKVVLNTISDLQGDYVQTYDPATTTGYQGGCMATFTPIAGTDSITITNFWTTSSPALVVKAKVDIKNKTISIPNQNLYVHSTYGQMDLCSINLATGKPDRTAPITGRILDDGSVVLDSWWGVYVVAGSYKDQFITANLNTLYERVNATMTTTTIVSGSPVTETWGVVVETPQSNVVKVKNFFNCGLPAEFELNSDRTATLPSQTVMINSNGSWNTIGSLVFNDEGKLTGYKPVITTEAKPESDNRTLTWTDWSLLTTGYFAGHITKGELKVNQDLNYPKLNVTALDGAGTQANPFKIKSLDDLIFIANKVNSETNLNYTTPPLTSPYARVFLGQYFELANDIDMGGYRFTPIGRDWSHFFAGTLDGKGHKISNLTVNTGSNGYAALFGRTDTTSVIKNIVFESPLIESSGNTSGVVAGWSLGTLENITVNSPKVISTGQCAAGLVGIGNYVRNCHVVNPDIEALGGFGAGLAGEIDKEITDCSVVGLKMVCYSSVKNSPFGGVVGSLYFGNMDNCYATGNIDGNSKIQSCTVGGVVGNIYYGTASNSFFVGRVSGYGSESIQGGVAGNLYGSMVNCFARGHVYGYSSRFTGGLAGYVRMPTTDRPNPVAKNCYSAVSLDAETYQYDPETETREIFGKIEDPTRFAPENCYFDNQLVNFGTVKYSVSTRDLTSATGPKNFPASDWTFRQGFYPVLKKSASSEAANFAASSIVLPEDNSVYLVSRNAGLHKAGNTRFLLLRNGVPSNEGNNLIIDGDSLKVKKTFGMDTIFMENGRGQFFHIVKVAPAFLAGSGTEEKPYLIKTKQDLINLSEITNEQKIYYPGVFFKFANDIDLEYDTRFKGICADANDAHCQFEGSIDGGGYTLHRMKIATVVWTVAPSAANNYIGTPKTGTGGSTGYSGFIGRLEAKGVLKNLNIAADCDLKETWATSGALVGTNNGIVENCRNYADVTAYSCWVGGIVGQSTKGSVIKDCYNAGTITTGYADAGGIAGQALGTVENCANAGDIYIISISNFQKPTDTKFKRGGGIVGGSYGGIFRNLLNVGSVTTLSGYAGGIIGNLPLASTSGSGDNSIVSTINYGQVIGNDLQYVGAIGGGTGSKGESKGTYYDRQISLWDACENTVLEGITGVTTAQLTSGKALADMDADAWVFEAGKYPVLKLFANEPKLQAARQIVVNMPEKTSARDMMANATLSSVSGMKWSLAKGDVYKIEGNTLKAPASVETLVVDTLKAEFSGMKKAIAIQAKPACPLQGEGSQDAPYLIGSTADWKNVITWMNKINDGLQGKYLKVTADIDFASMEDYTPMAGDGATFFKGTLDGDGHKFTHIYFSQTASYQGGVFGVIERTGVVKNITLEGVVDASKTYVGGVVGKLYGTLDNVTSNIKVRSTVGYVGGVAAMIYTGATLNKVINKGSVEGSGANIAGIAPVAEGSVKFTECGNEASILNKAASAVKYTAGILAVSNNPSEFVKCYNKGEISASSNETKSHPTIFAGIVAYCNASKDQADYIFTDCWNEGNISGAGILGGVTCDVNSTAGYTRFNMTRCYNKGKIEALATTAISSAPTAGVATFYPAGSTFTDCWNEGNVKSTKNIYSGGVAGYYKPTGTAAYPSKFIGCHNSGAIEAIGNQGGGITAASSSYTTFENCWNEGPITGGYILGGITGGQLGTSNVILNCWNEGSVTTSTNRAGGISAQYTSSNGGLIQGCFNLGEISSTSEVAGTTTSSGYGVAGISANCGGAVKDCYNLGNLKGACNVGGIAGQISKNNTKIENCYTLGKITAPDDTCGNIVGENTANGKKWDANNNYVKNCYYLEDVKVAKPNNNEGEAITMAQLIKKDMGEGWHSYDNFSMPVIAAHKDRDVAKLHSVHYTLDDKDSPEKVSKDFKVGAPEGVTWTSSLPEITINGNDAKINKTVKGDLKLTATCGKYSKEFNLKVDAIVDGIEGITDGLEIESELWFNMAGLQVTRPDKGDGQVYIVRVRYTDGSEKTIKVINR